MGVSIKLLVFLVSLLSYSSALSSSSSFPHLHRVVRPQSSASVQAAAVRLLLRRLLPADYAARFVVTVDERLGPRETLEVSATGGTVRVSGTSGVTAAAAVHVYLKKACGCSVSWAGEQLSLPTPLPDMAPFRESSNGPWRYYQNVCTESYSFAFWDWHRWERELDWMALHGINLPLAFVGQEAVWAQLWRGRGMTDEEVRTFLSGPAFLAWNRMGNLKGWGGPLSESWLKGRLRLQRKILQRMNEFGMTPVLPGFGGAVPDAFFRIYPKANVTRTSWYMDEPFKKVLHLQPNDPLFREIGADFVRRAIHAFNFTGHVYNADTFNEMQPASGDLEYLADASAAVLNGMKDADPEAVWMMQGWLFLSSFWNLDRARAYITAVPADRQIILDLASVRNSQFGRLHSYFGHPFIFCMLHNFGGQNSLYGYLPRVQETVVAALKDNVTAFSMVGTGLTPEGIEQNEIQYELMTEFGWRNETVDLTLWTSNFQRSRYGAFDAFADRGWRELLNSVYSCGEAKLMQDYLYRPSLKKSFTQCYPRVSIGIAWNFFVYASSSAALFDSDLFRYDLVDVTREALGAGASIIVNAIKSAVAAKNASAVFAAGRQMVDLLYDIDELLETDVHFLFGRRVAAARAVGVSEEDKDLMEFNLRAQVTTWTTAPNWALNDYAAKQWAGLMRDYYARRWSFFVSSLYESIATGVPFDDAAFERRIFGVVEWPFVESRTVYSTETRGEPREVASRLWQKWFPILYPELKQNSLKKLIDYQNSV